MPNIDIEINPKIFKSHVHTHHVVMLLCHYCNVDFVLFHNVTCYINSLSSRIHVNTTQVLNITCTLVATSVILWSLECILS